jgi:repressor of nif and glnA expression
VLRVITKWAENLESIFDNAEKFVLNRNYPFTTLSGKSVYPTSELKQQIFDQINAVREKKNRIHSELVAKNRLFQAEFLSKGVGDVENVTRFIKRYTETRIVASKMNTLIIKFM